MTNSSILIVDDDQELGEMLSEYLNKSDFRVTTATDGLLAADIIAKQHFDLIILDVMLPSLSGFDVLKRIRARLTVPVIMLTARGEDADCVLGLELGADDYLSKPFSLQQLTARVRAVLRRSVRPVEAPEQSRSVGPLTLFPATLTVQLRGKRLALTGTYWIAGNRELLRRAIENVLRNAIRFSAEGSEVTILTTRDGADLMICVRDRGPGVPEAERRRIFEPFYRVSSARDRDTGGSGLGLAITARVMALHGGQARAFNAEGGGLSVELRLPILDGHIENASNARSRIVQPAIVAEAVPRNDCAVSNGTA